jgi:SRSO17 transposase
MSTILEHPEAQALLEATTISGDTVSTCVEYLTPFLQRYLPCFYRSEHRQHADTILRGKLTGLQRKTTEPIARQAAQKRRPLQHFVGAGKWDDQNVLGELRTHVKEEMADSEGALVLDGSGFPKKGDDSCGVARQWCGRLGKIDNCQVGVFLGYVGQRGKALIDACLFLPEERANDSAHRELTYVPEDVSFLEKWRISLKQVRAAGREVPHGWIVGDDEFGRVSELREALRNDNERYALDVPCNTLIRDLSTPGPPARRGGRECLPQWERVDRWAARQPKKRWRRLRLRGGEKGPLEVMALSQQVQTKDEGGRVGDKERLLVLKSCEKKPRTSYVMSNAGEEVKQIEVAQAHGNRHGIEELFEEGNEEVGLDHYEPTFRR